MVYIILKTKDHRGDMNDFTMGATFYFSDPQADGIGLFSIPISCCDIPYLPIGYIFNDFFLHYNGLKIHPGIYMYGIFRSNPFKSKGQKRIF